MLRKRISEPRTNGAPCDSPGCNPGREANKSLALKGRHKVCCPFRAEGIRYAAPRVAPWAIFSPPLRGSVRKFFFLNSNILKNKVPTFRLLIFAFWFLQFPFRRHHALNSVIQSHGLRQRARRRLKNRFDNVMLIASV
jgi:hypothetical protein